MQRPPCRDGSVGFFKSIALRSSLLKGKDIACRKFVIGDAVVCWCDFLGSCRKLYVYVTRCLSRELEAPIGELVHVPLGKSALFRGFYTCGSAICRSEGRINENSAKVRLRLLVAALDFISLPCLCIREDIPVRGVLRLGEIERTRPHDLIEKAICAIVLVKPMRDSVCGVNRIWSNTDGQGGRVIGAI